jgi:cysteine desulfuration protein SufE
VEAPNDPLRALGLSKLLGMQRTQGLNAIYKKLRAEVQKKQKARSNGPA